MTQQSSSLSTQVPSPNQKKQKSSSFKKKTSRRSNKNKKSIKSPQTWRVFGVEVHPDDEVEPLVLMDGRDHRYKYVTRPVIRALSSRLKIELPSESDAMISLPSQILEARVIRKSLDARKNRRDGAGSVKSPMYNYVVDVDIGSHEVLRKLKNQPGRMERMDAKDSESSQKNENDQAYSSSEDDSTTENHKPKVVIVGAGPAGLFCALMLARSGKVTPILLERGQPVESRGKDIGALVRRRIINSESNFAFGEGGAGTWSDGKLTTRIGRNSENVRLVLETFVKYGAPEKILVDGAPHLGTDNLVRLLQAMREDIRAIGGDIRFGACMRKLNTDSSRVQSVTVEYSEAVERDSNGSKKSDYHGEEQINCDVAVLATGHSARDVYEELHTSGVELEAKGFATGFRVEHPQSIINRIQFGLEWGPSVKTGKKPTDEANILSFQKFYDEQGESTNFHPGRLPTASYRLATDKAYDGESHRGAYSFCMCPGGQIVPASTESNEVCVNGMSFSRRDSVWANSALVVTVSPEDAILDEYRDEYGVLAGLAFQRDMERRAAIMGGGDLVVPVQRLTDFIAGKASTTAPTSSYRIGVKPAACHEIYPEALTNALRDALVNHFDKQMKGFVCEEGLLHAVETRTSSPVRIKRDSETMEAIGIKNLYPAGEGAGFAGGIVSAAVDGIVIAEAILDSLVGEGKEPRQGKRVKTVGFEY